jgi:hypothetical protein
MIDFKHVSVDPLLRYDCVEELGELGELRFYLHVQCVKNAWIVRGQCALIMWQKFHFKSLRLHHFVSRRNLRFKAIFLRLCFTLLKNQCPIWRLSRYGRARLFKMGPVASCIRSFRVSFGPQLHPEYFKVEESPDVPDTRSYTECRITREAPQVCQSRRTWSYGHGSRWTLQDDRRIERHQVDFKFSTSASSVWKLSNSVDEEAVGCFLSAMEHHLIMLFRTFFPPNATTDGAHWKTLYSRIPPFSVFPTSSRFMPLEYHTYREE